jgi:tRNA modification GTPase
MTDSFNDTIAAVATPAGSGAVAIVRVSGPQALRIAQHITGRAPRARLAQLCEFRDERGARIDQGIVLMFPGPDSYTGEDVAEFQGHGGSVVSDWLLETCFKLGARAAQPGEFTMRAFLNDKLDLAQAEAVADLVASSSRTTARAALRSLRGHFSETVREIQEQLTGLRVQVEAHLDFPEEPITPENVSDLRRRGRQLLDSLRVLHGNARRGAVLNDGIVVVIAGPPNAGKSSLLNRLAGYDAAIVTSIPGTTRDPLRERLVVDGLPITVVDTAGLRESSDPIEGEGLRRAHRELRRADHVLWVVDISNGGPWPLDEAVEAISRTARRTLILNKVDLVAEEPGETQVGDMKAVRLSALTGQGIESLIAHLKAAAGWSDATDGAFTARRRHLEALTTAEAHLREGLAHVDSALELAAEELRSSQRALSELTGELTSEDLLDRIFSSFCIGK